MPFNVIQAPVLQSCSPAYKDLFCPTRNCSLLQETVPFLLTSGVLSPGAAERLGQLGGSGTAPGLSGVIKANGVDGSRREISRSQTRKNRQRSR